MQTVVCVSTLIPRFLNEIRALLRNHNRRRVRMRRRYVRHNTRVDYSQSRDPMNAELRVYHCVGVAVWSHLAGPTLVVDGEGEHPRVALPVGVRIEDVVGTPREFGREELSVKSPHSWGCEKLLSLPHASD